MLLAIRKERKEKKTNKVMLMCGTYFRDTQRPYRDKPTNTTNFNNLFFFFFNFPKLGKEA